MTAAETLIEIQDLHKYYGKGASRHHVLKGIDLSICSGEFISIVGTSGSGKTTLLNIIGGLDRDFGGVVKIRSHDIQKLSDRLLSRLRNETVGFIFQAFNLLPHLSCAENIILPSYFHGTTSKRPKERAAELLESVNLADKIDSTPTELSGGQKQRISIARALFNKPRLILCDEPTGSLDRRTSQQIVSLFRQLNRDSDLTFVIVTHDEHLSQVCDRIIRLEDGTIISDTRHAPVPYASVVSAPVLEATSLGTMRSEHHLPSVVTDSAPLGDWLPDEVREPLELTAEFGERRLQMNATLHSIDWRLEPSNAPPIPDAQWIQTEGGELNLNRAFTCLLTRSSESPQQVHLTIRQRTLSSDEETAPTRPPSWHQIGLSATVRDHDVLTQLPEKPEHFPRTDEASLQHLLGLLQTAMRRHGQERWY